MLLGLSMRSTRKIQDGRELLKNGEMAGVIGQSLRVEALRARLTGPGSEKLSDS